jgi:hypothetical protein
VNTETQTVSETVQTIATQNQGTESAPVDASQAADQTTGLDVEVQKRFQMLAQAEKKRLQKYNEMKTELDSKKDMLKEAEQYRALKQKIASKDYTALNELGVNFDELALHKLNGGDESIDYKMKRLEESFKNTLEQKLADKETEFAKRVEETRSKAWLSEVSNFIESKKEDYPFLLDQPDASDVVLGLITEASKKHNMRMTVDEAAKKANEYYQTQYKTSVTKFKDKSLDYLLESYGITKEEFDKLLQAKSKSGQSVGPGSAQVASGSKTLSNTPSVSAPSEAPKFKTKAESIDYLTKKYASLKK